MRPDETLGGKGELVFVDQRCQVRLLHSTDNDQWKKACAFCAMLDKALAGTLLEMGQDVGGISINTIIDTADKRLLVDDGRHVLVGV